MRFIIRDSNEWTFLINSVLDSNIATSHILQYHKILITLTLYVVLTVLEAGCKYEVLVKFLKADKIVLQKHLILIMLIHKVVACQQCGIDTYVYEELCAEHFYP